MMPKWMRLLLWSKPTDGVQAYKRASEKLMELSSNVLNQCEKKPRVLGNKRLYYRFKIKACLSYHSLSLVHKPA